ncbi:MAG: glutamate--tRNA ligase family protein [bacterium]
MKSKNKVVTRMAPSPTGNLHIGGVRTALFNYLFAKQNGGKFILRIEDTDKERSEKKYEENILESFKWLRLGYDELYRQSEREDVYKKYLQQLLDNGTVYVSKEEEGDRSEVIRFKNLKKKIVFDDVIRGQVEFDTTDLGDFVVAKSLEEPLYHLAVVVDDYEMEVTHVIRGEEHLSNTPRQILIQEAVGAPRPVYAHIPLILAPDRSKLSKRAGAVSALEYKEGGYLPEAILNYLALLGWNPGTEQEIFSLEELIKIFDIEKIQKGGAIFDTTKLKWVNKEWMKREIKIVNKKIENKIKEKYKVEYIHPEITKVVFDRVETLNEVDEFLKAGELDYFFSESVLGVEKIVWKKTTQENTVVYLKKVVELIENDADIMAYAQEVARSPSLRSGVSGRGKACPSQSGGRGLVLWPLRYALSGREKSPDPLTLLSILGKEEAIKRIKKAINILES